MTPSERVRAWRQYLSASPRFELLERYHQHRLVKYCEREYGDELEMGGRLPNADDLIEGFWIQDRGVYVL